MIKKIQRLAEINAANTFIEIDIELRNERKIIVNYLKIMNIIELDNNGGFHFIGDNKNKHKEIYLESFNNF